MFSASLSLCVKIDSPQSPHTYTCVTPVRSLANATWSSSNDHDGCGCVCCGPYTVSPEFSIQLKFFRASAKSSATA